MTFEQIKTHALSHAGAHFVIQWADAHVFKVGDKVFAIVSSPQERITLKCADVETADFLIEIGAATRAPHLPRGGWISLPIADVADAEMAERITTSYETVRATLPAKQRKALG